jgi:hypothetical protein
MYKLTNDEKVLIENIQIMTGYDFAVIRNVMVALNITTAIELYAGEGEVPIPFLFRMKLRYYRDDKNKVREHYQIESTKHFKGVLKKLTAARMDVVESYLETEIRAELKKNTFKPDALIGIPPD